MGIRVPAFDEVMDMDDPELEAAWRERVDKTLAAEDPAARRAFADEVIVRGERCAAEWNGEDATPYDIARSARRGLAAMLAWPHREILGYFREMRREGVI